MTERTSNHDGIGAADPMRFRRKVVGVVGSSEVTGETATQTRAVGAAICRLGAHLVCGGLGGVMEEACRGFVDKRLELAGRDCGVTIGMLPGEFKNEANPFVDVIVPTGLGIIRNVLVVQSSDVVVSIAGGAGTLTEMAAAWKKGKIIIAMSSTGGWSRDLAGKAMDGRRPDTVIDAADPAEVERRLEKLLGPAPERS